MNNQYLRILLFFCVLLTSAKNTIAESTSSADSIYLNARIYTVDGKQSRVEAVAIKDGRFIAIGSDEVIKTHIGKDTRVNDLDGKMVMPGIHDGHNHVLEAGKKALYECNLRIPKLQQLAAQLKDCRSKVRGKPSWLVVNLGFGIKDAPGLDKAFLDNLYPDVAVIAREFNYHYALANSKALSLAGINKNTPDPEGGKIDRHPDNGEISGVLIDTAQAAAFSKIPPFTVDEKIAAIQAMSELYSRNGITSLQYPGVVGGELEAIKKLEAAGGLKQFVSAHMVWGKSVLGKPDSTLLDRRDEYTTDLIRLDGIKVFLDGTSLPPYFNHVDLLEDGSIDPTHLMVSEEVLNENLVKWDKAGLRVKMHAAGRGSVRVALNAIEQARKHNGDSGILHEIAHIHRVAPEDMKRLKQLNTVAEISPVFGSVRLPKGVSPPPRFEHYWQFRSLIENGALVTGGSDYPVTPIVSPFPTMPRTLSRADQSISLPTMLEILTINGARTIGREKDLGSIEMGKIANMIVLNQNLFDIPIPDISRTKVLLTVLQGEEVYKASD